MKGAHAGGTVDRARKNAEGGGSDRAREERGRMPSRPEEDELYRFERFGRVVRFDLQPSVTKWLTLRKTSENMGDARDVLGGEILDFPRAEAYHDIVEVLNIFCSTKTLKRYFAVLHVPGADGTERTFYAAASLARYDEQGGCASLVGGDVEVGSEAHRQFSLSYPLWHFRFREAAAYSRGYRGRLGLGGCAWPWAGGLHQFSGGGQRGPDQVLRPPECTGEKVSLQNAYERGWKCCVYLL